MSGVSAYAVDHHTSKKQHFLALPGSLCVVEIAWRDRTEEENIDELTERNRLALKVGKTHTVMMTLL